MWTLSWSGCSTVLPPDPSMPTLEANYPTAEFSVGDQVFHGLGEVSIEKGEPLSALQFNVQGYFDGAVRVDSSRCDVHLSQRYKDSQQVTIPLMGPATTSCIFDITVSPTFPNQKSFLDTVYELKGELLVKVLEPGEHWYGFSSRIRRDGEARLLVPVPTEDQSAQVVFRGCGISYDSVEDLTDKSIDISTIDFMPDMKKERCVLEGFVRYEEIRIKKVTWRIWGFSPDFSPLSEPVIVEKDDRLFVEGDLTVAAVSLDNEFILGSDADFKFDNKKDHILRLVTVKGRSVLCRYLTKRGKWWCIR